MLIPCGAHPRHSLPGLRGAGEVAARRSNAGTAGTSRTNPTPARPTPDDTQQMVAQLTRRSPDPPRPRASHRQDTTDLDELIGEMDEEIDRRRHPRLPHPR